ncbi:putative Periplasmic protein TonB, links inner and outer membranes [uncultured Defluviicoccus sp.]|uniref:Putative Periplasmic protein TonB, links inner and outer membranes n=1 Tax=metagenome TaxID=256318 RepID=A0A380TJ42_9ZZZZ|nr:putative Periplasmic protein TonB, links inner and outer membranes [uncultured Defluviicoccus sp.]
MARLDAAAGPAYADARGAESGHTPLSLTAWPQQRLIWIGASVLALALIVLGALVIVSSSRGPDAPKDAAQVPIIHAEEKPFKVRPENPGGMEIPHQDKLIYQRLRGEERPIKVERLLSEPEKPLPPPEPAPPPEAAHPGTAPMAAPRAGDDSDPAAADAIERSIVERGLVEAPGAEAGDADEEEGMLPDEAAGDEAATTSNIPVPRPRPSMRASETAALAPSTAPPSAAPAAAPATAPAAPGASGSFRIQLGAFASPDKVDAEWRRLQAQHPALLGALKPESTRVEVPDRGILYRLRAGPVEGEERARTLCQDLVRRGAGCLVVQPRG